MILADLLIGAPSWVPVAAIVVAVVGLLALRGYRHAWMSPGLKWLACLLKVAGVALLAVCLIEPLFSGVRPRPGANLFVILTDNSQSMTVQSGSAVRGDSLRAMLGDDRPWRTRLEQDFDVRDYMFDHQVKHVGAPDELTFDGAGSSLHTALDTLRSRFEQRPVAGVILLSDGNATDLPSKEAYPFPIYPIVDEDSAVVKDIRIRTMNVSQTNFEASPVTIAAVVASQGFDGQEVTGRIVSQAGKTLQETSKTVKSNQDLEFRFRFRPEESGLSFHRLEVFPTNARGQFEKADSADELTLANNTRWISVQRGGGPYRILYVSGRPNWEFKFLKRGLQEDDEIRLTGLIRIAKKQPKFVFQDRSGVSDRNQLFEGFDGKDDEDAEAHDQTVFIRIDRENETDLADGFPKDAEELFQYHAVILDDIEAKFFSASQMLLLRRFVSQRGGGLIMLGGQESFIDGGYRKTPLGEVLPVYLNQVRPSDGEKYRWELTREGWLQDWTRLRTEEQAERKRLDAASGFGVVNRVSGVKPGASLLAMLQTDQGRILPGLATQRFGNGRSAALLVGDLWMWGMHQDPKQQDLQQMWRQIIRWMVADVPMRVEVDTERGRGAVGPSSVLVSVRDEDFKPHDNAEVQVKVRIPSGEEVELTAEPSMREAGLYTVDFWPREEGPYRASALVTTAEGEELDEKDAGWTSQPGAEEFRELSTNQEVLQQIVANSEGQLVQVDDLEAFVSALPNRKVPVTETWVYPVWHQAWVLALAMVCLCGEWGLRRWKGLP